MLLRQFITEAVIALFLVVPSALPNTPQSQQAGALLDFIDRHYPRDYRYDHLLGAIAERLQATESRVFRGAEKTVTCFVYAGPFGCNAAAVSEKVVIIDSLLLEALDRFTAGVAYYGGVDNPLTRQLVQAIGSISVDVPVDLRQPNPFGLPRLPYLSEQQRFVARRLFEQGIAFAFAHEVAHCMLLHPVTLFNLGTVLSELVPQDVLGQRGNLFLSAFSTPSKILSEKRVS